MAIKISGTTVIDDNRDINNIGIITTTGDIISLGNLGIGTITPTGAAALTNNEAALAVGIVTANTVYGTTEIVAQSFSAHDPIGGTNNQTRDKYRVWNSSAYTIGMKNGFTFGALGGDGGGSDGYAMTFQMNNTATRGFWWGENGQTDAQGAMSLNVTGELVVAKSIRAGGGESDLLVPRKPLDIVGDGIISGDVGIGTTNPTGAAALTSNEKVLAVGVVTANTLYVNGTEVTGGGGGGGGASGLWASNATGINTSTNVGIATTTASAMLEIGSSGVATATTLINTKAWDGQTFNVDGNITSDSIFAVNDISGLPVIDYNASHGNLSLAPFGGNISIGYTNSGTKLGLKGSTSERVYVSIGSSLSNVTDDQINIDNGNVHYYSIPETGGELNAVDITSNNTLNVDLAIGDSATVVVIIKPDSEDDKITGLEIDGTAVTEEWLGGSPPVGGESGSYDVYTFFILKTADATFLPLCNKVNYA